MGFSKYKAYVGVMKSTERMSKRRKRKNLLTLAVLWFNPRFSQNMSLSTYAGLTLTFVKSTVELAI